MINVPEYLPPKIKKMIKQFLSKTHRILGRHFKKAILYGYFARGNYEIKDEIAILVLTDLKGEELDKYKEEILDCSYEVEWDSDFYATMVARLRNIDEYEVYKHSVQMYKEIDKEGIVIKK